MHNLTALVEELEQTFDVIDTLSVRDLGIEQLSENVFGDINVRHIDLSHNVMLKQVQRFLSHLKASGECYAYRSRRMHSTVKMRRYKS